MARLLAPGSPIIVTALPDLSLLGDKDALKQVLLILVDNAHKHNPPGTPVEILADAAQGTVSIGVHDLGPGIATEVLPHTFERFLRGKVSRSGPGAGLGLSIAKELIEGQGGSIAVQSAAGQGSTFTVSLPETEA